jgi:hypothetical protein
MRMQDLYGGQNGLFDLGQYGMLKVGVTLDGKPVAGASIEVMLAGDASEKGVTDASGLFAIPYGEQHKSATIRLLSSPVDIGEDANQDVALKSSLTEYTFALKTPVVEKTPVAPVAQTAPMPVAAIVGGLLVVGIIAGNVFLKKY